MTHHWELQVLQVQAEESGSSTEAQKLNIFIGCFCLRHCQEGKKEEVEQQQYFGQLCGRWRDNHPETKGAVTKAGVCSAIFLGELLLIGTGTGDSEPPHMDTSPSPPETRLRQVEEALSFHHQA